MAKCLPRGYHHNTALLLRIVTCHALLPSPHACVRLNSREPEKNSKKARTAEQEMTQTCRGHPIGTALGTFSLRSDLWPSNFSAFMSQLPSS
jgi:hypothetical protein